MRITNISEAKANLSRLVEFVRDSDRSVFIGKAGKPVAVLSAFKASKIPRKLGGSWEGKVKIADDFDKLPNEWIDAFYDSLPALKESSPVEPAFRHACINLGSGKQPHALGACP